MKLLIFLLFTFPLAFAEPQVCPGTIQLSESDEGPLFSGTLTEGTYTSKFSYVDDDGLLTLIVANNVILQSNKQFSGTPPQNYRISDRDKNLVLQTLNRQLSYNQEALAAMREAAASNTPQPEDAPTIAQVEELSKKAQALVGFVSGLRNQVSAADWNSKVGKYIKEELRGGHVYQSKKAGFNGKFDTHGLCGSTVRCPCSINSSPFNRSRLCGIDYENPAPKTGEYVTCSSFNLTIESGGPSSGSSNSKDSTRTQGQ